MNILIFAGGSGTRLWPISRKATPKQLLKIINDKTLLQNTYERCLKWTRKDSIYIATLSEYKSHVKKQLPEIPDKRYSLEPVLRDRGPAIGLAALIMHHQNPNSCFMTMWSDHDIKESKNYFKDLLKQVESYLDKHPETTVTIGIKPTFPHTGFGYIETGKKISNTGKLPLYQVNSFKEKPDLKTASAFLKSKKYLWNTGYFIWKTETLLSLYEKHLPEVYEILMKIKPFLGTSKLQTGINKWYPKMPKVEVENGLLEKITDNILTIQAEFDWNDIGSWKVIKDIQSSSQQNVSQGLHLDHSSQGVMVYNQNPKQLVATLGLKNTIVVVTPDAILVADKDDSEQLKKIVSALKEDRKLAKYL